jgi:glycosyltransferase involved in cell wall biosynthesis
MAAPQISVITPAFRPADFTAYRASLAANQADNVEWILVDDGSGPEFEAAFASMVQLGARLVRLPENKGQAAARNAGIAAAQGSWIKFLDADDTLSNGHLSTLLNAAETDDTAAIAFAPTRHIFPSGKSYVNDSWRDLPVACVPQLERMIHSAFLSHCGALFPRALLQKLDGYDEMLVTDEDGDLILRVLLSGACFKPVPGVNYGYLHHPGPRVSADGTGRKLASRLAVCDKLCRHFESAGKPMPRSIRRALAMRLDAIAMAYWATHRREAVAVLRRAEVLFPNYPKSGSRQMRLLRRLAGPSAALAAAQLSRRLRGFSAGDAVA